MKKPLVKWAVYPEPHQACSDDIRLAFFNKYPDAKNYRRKHFIDCGVIRKVVHFYD